MSMVVVCHIHIHDGQHHKYKCLQGDNKNMKNCPNKLQGAAHQNPGGHTAEHDRNQDKDHFTRIHIAKQSQRM